MKEPVEIIICLGSSCFARGNSRVLAEIERLIEERGLQGRVLVRGSRCEGACAGGPNIRIAGVARHGVRVEDVASLLDEALGGVGESPGGNA
jgi:NADH:ubiquinone oxidoreductase subunit E